MNKEPWYKAYAYHAGHEDILLEFDSVEDFEKTVPHNHKININKITFYESCVWLKYEKVFGGYPSIQQIKLGRNKRPNGYTVLDLLQEDNYGEHF